MTTEMRRTHYPLQALLYCVALHRFLGDRLPDYDPHRHLGGVGYLFVRGLGGPQGGPETGVFAWQPPAGLVVALSQLLADRGNR
jgi:exodeoxyribonuclease V beta subunit